MLHEIRTISLDGTNCYLVKTDSGYILIDTGFPFQRSNLEKALEKEGCKPGNLKLIVVTHGDIDHTGNCAFLREKYGSTGSHVVDKRKRSRPCKSSQIR